MKFNVQRIFCAHGNLDALFAFEIGAGGRWAGEGERGV